MKIKTAIVLAVFAAGFLSNGCASVLKTDYYREQRKVNKLVIPPPDMQAKNPGKNFRFNNRVVVLPFIDLRSPKGIHTAFNKPLSALMQQYLCAAAVKENAFKNISLAAENLYMNGNEYSVLPLNEKNLKQIKSASNADTAMWGTIKSLDFIFEPCQEDGYYNVTASITGEIRINIGRGASYISKTFSKKIKQNKMALNPKSIDPAFSFMVPESLSLDLEKSGVNMTIMTMISTAMEEEIKRLMNKQDKGKKQYLTVQAAAVTDKLLPPPDLNVIPIDTVIKNEVNLASTAWYER